MTANNETNTTTSAIILSVYTEVEFSDFEHCRAGCWACIVVFAVVISAMVLRPVLKRILPNFRDLFLACSMVLLEILADILEVLYAILGWSKLVSGGPTLQLTTYNKCWLALSSIGFGLGGLCELLGLGDAFCRRTVRQRVLGTRLCCFFAPSEQEEVRSRLERFPRLSEGLRWGWFRRGVWAEVFFLYLCFSLLATVTLPKGYLCWLLYPIGTMVISCGLLKMDPNDGQGATAFLFPRALEATVVTAPLLIIEVLATKSLGFVTGALLIRDALDILWTLWDYCQTAKQQEEEQKVGIVMPAKEKLKELMRLPTRTTTAMREAMSSTIQQPSSR